MIQGVSTFSGRNVPRGCGVYKITADGRAILTASNKEAQLIRRKINPRDVKWTAISREFTGKEVQYAVEKLNVQQSVKIIRGFRRISGSSIAKAGKQDETVKK